MSRVNIHDLLDRMADAERAFAAAQFVAPCVCGGRVRARVCGIVQTFAPEPADFEGWGVFQASDDGKRARVVEEADLPLVAGYLALFPVLRLRLVEPLAGRTWLAYPVNEGDMAQRFGGTARPVALHLVDEGRAFETVVARAVGGGFWFEEIDRRADPLPGEALRDALRALTEPDGMTFAGITPEMRTTYRISLERSPAYRERQRRIEAERRAAQRRRAVRAFARHGYGTPGGPADPVADTDERRLQRALGAGGGQLREAVDRGEFYLVEWETGEGVRHTSAIAKGDLTVLSSGICLAGRDRDFDLQSLVGVIDRRTTRDRDEH